jgi:hypothetical protein
MTPLLAQDSAVAWSPQIPPLGLKPPVGMTKLEGFGRDVYQAPDAICAKLAGAALLATSH